MCGIYGEFVFKSGRVPGLYAEDALDALRHRGPDDGAIWRGSEVALGMRRLSIIDLDHGMQPIWNETKTCCVICNGEIYNFSDLRDRLQARGHVFQTGSDTEVILHGYEEWGVGCLNKFNGMFAFAVWDEPRKTLFVARDRLGEKPLYYYRDTERLIFASEIKALLKDPSVPRRVSHRGLRNFLAFGHAAAPDTIYEHIFKLLPGQYLIADKSGVQFRQYWDVGDEPYLSEELDEHGYRSAVLELLDDSVRRRMVADVPVGAFLSGGVDSSCIVALMKRHTTTRVKTFSLGFRTQGAYNELSDARVVARHLGTEHHELELDSVDLVQTLRTLVYHYDEPFADAACFPTYLLSRFAREHVKVILAGDGGDELFAGYRRYAMDRLASLVHRLPKQLTEAWLPSIIHALPRIRRLKRVVQTLPIRDPARRYGSWLVLFNRDMQAELLQSDGKDDEPDYDPLQIYSRYYSGLSHRAADDHVNRLLYMDVKTWLPDTYLEKVDKATMACGLEGRLPFLDHRLVELAFQIPSRFKIRGFSGKRILKQAIASLVPSSVLTKSKHGFAVPTDPWFRGPLKSFAFDVLFDGPARRRGYFNTAMVERLWRQHTDGKEVWDGHLWLLMNFELWHRIHLDGEPV
jgi:asparagine synthase (glutamine-hydrolysing)